MCCSNVGRLVFGCVKSDVYSKSIIAKRLPSSTIFYFNPPSNETDSEDQSIDEAFGRNAVKKSEMQKQIQYSWNGIVNTLDMMIQTIPGALSSLKTFATLQCLHHL